jgi:hypothetical protein
MPAGRAYQAAMAAPNIAFFIAGTGPRHVVRNWNNLPRYCRLTWHKALPSMTRSVVLVPSRFLAGRQGPVFPFY